MNTENKTTELRERFFNECVKEVDVISYDKGIETLPRIWKEPREVFEWFKPYLQGTIDWEGLEKSFYAEFGSWFINDPTSDVTNWLKTNLPKYIK